eukprot:3570791-Rhodomonas_salina.3
MTRNWEIHSRYLVKIGIGIVHGSLVSERALRFEQKSFVSMEERAWMAMLLLLLKVRPMVKRTAVQGLTHLSMSAQPYVPPCYPAEVAECAVLPTSSTEVLVRNTDRY